MSLYIELDDLDHFDNLLADAVSANCRRYSSMIGDIVQELLPNYKDHEVNKLLNYELFSKEFKIYPLFSHSSLKTKMHWMSTLNIEYWPSKDKE